jgi:hypothetical protein
VPLAAAGPESRRDGGPYRQPVPFVAIDSNVVDLLFDAEWSPAHIDAMEAMEEPPPFEGVEGPKLRRELWACYWLRALAPAWPGVLYTFADLLYVENAAADRGQSLNDFAALYREGHNPEDRTVDPERAPGAAAVMSCGVRGRADAEHVSDAIGMGCNVLLTNDRKLRNRSPAIEARWPIRLRRPSEFLIEAVRDERAPWSVRARWPWEQLDDL